VSKATRVPSPLIDGPETSSSAGVSPAPPRLASVVVPAARSRTNTWRTPFVASLTRLVASLLNATRVPSALITGSWELPLPPGPVPPARLTSTVSPVTRSRRKTFS
jgi:hypothetical protein